VVARTFTNSGILANFKPYSKLTLNRAAIQIDVVVRLEVIYDFQATNRREGGDTSCRGRSQEAPGLHLERARDHEGGPRTAWCADYWRGECLARGWC
jgi:hypothetical protein